MIRQTVIPMHERKWIDTEPSEPTLDAYEVSKKVISLLRHNQKLQREEEGQGDGVPKACLQLTFIGKELFNDAECCAE